MTTTTTPHVLPARSHAGRWTDLIVFTVLVWSLALLCAFALHGTVDFAMLDSAPGWVWGVLILTSWLPALAALGTQLIRTGSASGFTSGWRWPGLRWVLISFAIPCVYTTAVAAFTWITGAGTLDVAAFEQLATKALGNGWASPKVVALCYALLTIVGGTLALIPFALGEELGWSGFVIPKLLSRLGIARTALITGVLWSSYHFPLILLAKNYTQGTPIWFTIVGMTISLIGIAFISTWLRVRTVSIWPAVLLHASHNVLIFYLYEPLTKVQPATPYVGGEHGLGMMVIAAVLVLLVTRFTRSVADTSAG